MIFPASSRNSCGQPFRVGLHAHDLALLAAAPAPGQLRHRALGLKIIVEPFDVHAAHAHAVHHRVIVGLGVSRAGEGREVAIGGAIHKRLRQDRLAPGPAFRDHAFDAGALHDRPGQQRVDRHKDTGLHQHLEGDQLVEFRVNGGADRIVIVTGNHFRVSRGAANLGQPVHDFLRNAFDHLLLGHAGKGLPQIEVAVQRGAAFHHGSARIAFALDQHGFRALPRRRDGRHHAGRAAAGDHDVEFPDGQFLGGFLVPAFRRFLSFFRLAHGQPGWKSNAQQGNSF